MWIRLPKGGHPALAVLIVQFVQFVEWIYSGVSRPAR